MCNHNLFSPFLRCCLIETFEIRVGPVDVSAKNTSNGQMITENELCHRTSFPLTGPVEYTQPFYVAREGVASLGVNEGLSCAV